MGDSYEGITVLFSKDGRFCLTEGMKSLDLVWDEPQWKQVDVKGLRSGMSRWPMACYSTCMHRCCLMSVSVCFDRCSWRHAYRPAPGVLRFAQHHDGTVDAWLLPVLRWFYCARTVCGGDKPWYPLDWFSTDTPVTSEEDMTSRMLLPRCISWKGKAEKRDGTGSFEDLLQALMPQMSAVNESDE